MYRPFKERANLLILLMAVQGFESCALEGKVNINDERTHLGRVVLVLARTFVRLKIASSIPMMGLNENAGISDEAYTGLFWIIKALNLDNGLFHVTY
jgi:hypothetical protein